MTGWYFVSRAHVSLRVRFGNESSVNLAEAFECLSRRRVPRVPETCSYDSQPSTIRTVGQASEMDSTGKPARVTKSTSFGILEGCLLIRLYVEAPLLKVFRQRLPSRHSHRSLDHRYHSQGPSRTKSCPLPVRCQVVMRLCRSTRALLPNCARFLAKYRYIRPCQHFSRFKASAACLNCTFQECHLTPPAP